MTVRKGKTSGGKVAQPIVSDHFLTSSQRWAAISFVFFLTSFFLFHFYLLFFFSGTLSSEKQIKMK